MIVTILWMLRRRWLVRSAMRRCGKQSRYTLIRNLIMTKMIRQGSFQHRDCLRLAETLPCN